MITPIFLAAACTLGQPGVETSKSTRAYATEPPATDSGPTSEPSDTATELATDTAAPSVADRTPLVPAPVSTKIYPVDTGPALPPGRALVYWEKEFTSFQGHVIEARQGVRWRNGEGDILCEATAELVVVGEVAETCPGCEWAFAFQPLDYSLFGEYCDRIEFESWHRLADNEYPA